MQEAARAPSSDASHDRPQRRTPDAGWAGLVYDLREIPELPAERLALVFGAEVLMWVTGLVYREGGRIGSNQRITNIVKLTSKGWQYLCHVPGEPFPGT